MTIIPLAIVQGASRSFPCRVTTRTTSRRSPRPRPASTTTSTVSRRTTTTGPTARPTRRRPRTRRSRIGCRSRARAPTASASATRPTRRRRRDAASSTSRRPGSGHEPDVGCSSAGVIRTVKLGLRRQGFLDYLWLTDYEITDPVLSGRTVVVHVPLVGVEPHGATGTGRHTSNCSDRVLDRRWRSLNGPVHTNDGLYVCGSPSSTATPTPTTTRRRATTCSTARVRRTGTRPCSIRSGARTRRHSPDATMTRKRRRSSPFPPANTSIRTQADGAQGGTGCLYTGPTTITLLSDRQDERRRARRRSRRTPGAARATT